MFYMFIKSIRVKEKGLYLYCVYVRQIVHYVYNFMK